MSDAIPASKVCTKCGRHLAIDEFYRQSRSRDGRRADCKDCFKSYRSKWASDKRERINAQNRAWKAANKDVVRASNRAWYEKNRERHLENSRAWYEANRERRRDKARAWREANRDFYRAIQRQWREDNPELELRRASRARAKRRFDMSVSASSAPIDFSLVWSQQDGICPLCDEAIDAALAHPNPQSKSIDHIVPLSKGGSHSQSNVQWTHLVCNLRKGASDVGRDTNAC